MSTAWQLLGRVLFWLAWPALKVYLRRGERTRVYVLAGDKVLLVQGWLSDGTWMLPGGGLHRNEVPVEGAAREVAEETGIHVAPSELRHLSSGWETYRGLRSYMHFYAVRLNAVPDPRPQRGEIVAAQWCRAQECSRLPVRPEVGRALQLLADPD